MVQCTCISLYLTAIVVANLAVARFGQAALPVTAFLLVPMDLITRDVLHECWERDRWLWPKMAMLIVGGSLLTVCVSSGAWRVALGSSLGFMAAGGLNAVVYWIMAGRARFVRMNTSNFFAAWGDSIVFPMVAFDVVSWTLIAMQAGSKFAGGIFFSTIYCSIKAHKKRPGQREADRVNKAYSHFQQVSPLDTRTGRPHDTHGLDGPSA